MSYVQVIPKAAYNVLFGGANLYIDVIGGLGDCAQSATFGSNYGRHPVSVPGTFSKITYASFDLGFKPDVTVTLQVNGVDTALSVTLLAADTVATNGVNSVAVVAGDDIQYKISGTQGGGHSGAMCISFETADGSTTFGISRGAQNQDRIGGILGNGFYNGYTGVEADSNTYSICASAGVLTRLDLRSFVAPGSDVWVGKLIKDGVIQDGSGGTVDTRVTFTGSGFSAFSTFSLPITPPNHLNVIITRTSGASGLTIAASVGFLPTTAGEYMLCGGNNNPVGGGSHVWNHSLQGALGTEALAPINATGLTARGLYIERSAGTGPGDGTIYTIRKNQVNTAITVTVQGLVPPFSGSILNTPIDFVSGDYIDLSLANIGSGGGGQLHWGLTAQALFIPPPVVPPPPGCPLGLPLTVVAGEPGCPTGV